MTSSGGAIGRGRGDRLRRLLLVAAACVSAAAMSGNADASHGRYLWSGSWTTGFGTLSLRTLDAQELAVARSGRDTRAMFNQLRCAPGAVYYRGAYLSSGDRGIVLGCAAGDGRTLVARFLNPRAGIGGTLDLALGSTRPLTFAGTFREDSGARRSGTYAGTWQAHFARDSSTPATASAPTSAKPPGSGKPGSGSTTASAAEYTWEVAAGGIPYTTFFQDTLAAGTAEGKGTARTGNPAAPGTGSLDIDQAFTSAIREIGGTSLAVTVTVVDAIVGVTSGGLRVDIEARASASSSASACPLGQKVRLVLFDRTASSGGDSLEITTSSEETGCWRLPRRWTPPQPVSVVVKKG